MRGRIRELEVGSASARAGRDEHGGAGRREPRRAARGPLPRRSLRDLTANKTLIGSADVASLASSGQRAVVPFTAPAAPGSYAVGVEIDDQRRVPGDDRSNNTSGPAQLLVK